MVSLWRVARGNTGKYKRQEAEHYYRFFLTVHKTRIVCIKLRNTDVKLVGKCSIFNAQFSMFSWENKNYGEVQGAEARSDFIHKMRVVLKELKECRTALKIIIRKGLIKPVKKLSKIYQETEELIAISGKSISTALKNKDRKSTRLNSSH